MNPSFDHTWKPDPQLLAAYFDGELEGRDEMADVRADIEAWLQTNPDAVAEWNVHRQLKEIWLDTIPAEPPSTAWRDVVERIDAHRHEPSFRRTSWLAAVAVAACIALVCGMLVWRLAAPGLPRQQGPIAIAPKEAPTDEEAEVFAVATADEVTILRVDGADVESLVVGELPLEGPLELANPGDVFITASHCPRTRVRQKGPARPMVWARLDAE